MAIDAAPVVWKRTIRLTPAADRCCIRALLPRQRWRRPRFGSLSLVGSPKVQTGAVRKTENRTKIVRSPTGTSHGLTYPPGGGRLSWVMVASDLKGVRTGAVKIRGGLLDGDHHPALSAVAAGAWRRSSGSWQRWSSPAPSFADVARRYEVSRGLLWNWRRQVRRGELVPEPMPAFLPVQITADPPVGRRRRFSQCPLPRRRGSRSPCRTELASVWAPMSGWRPCGAVMTAVRR